MNIKIEKIEHDGSAGELVIITLSHALTEGRKKVFERRMQARCNEEIHSISWVSNQVVHVEIYRRCVREAGRLDIAVAAKHAVAQMPMPQ